MIIDKQIINSENQTIKTIIYRPEDIDMKVPLFILCHGFYVTHKYFEYYAKELINYNFACILFDFRGGLDENQSSGSLLDSSILTEVEDLETIVEYVDTLDYVDHDQIYLLGHSQGAFVASITASRNPEKFRSIILLAPAFLIPDEMKEKKLPNEDELIDNKVGLISRKYILDARKIKVFDDLTNYTRNVYIFHGLLDDAVSIKYSQEAVKEYENAQLMVLDDQKHNFTRKARDLVIEKILEITGEEQ